MSDDTNPGSRDETPFSLDPATGAPIASAGELAAANAAMTALDPPDEDGKPVEPITEDEYHERISPPDPEEAPPIIAAEPAPTEPPPPEQKPEPAAAAPVDESSLTEPAAPEAPQSALGDVAPAEEPTTVSEA